VVTGSFPVTYARRWRAAFNPKVDFLVEQRKISEVVGQVVKALDRYRNDAYHRDKVRWATLHAAAVVYYEAVCQLLVALPPLSLGYASTEDWSDFQDNTGSRSTT
jgi:hypothetical protein